MEWRERGGVSRQRSGRSHILVLRPNAALVVALLRQSPISCVFTVKWQCRFNMVQRHKQDWRVEGRHQNFVFMLSSPGRWLRLSYCQSALASTPSINAFTVAKYSSRSSTWAIWELCSKITHSE